MVSSLNLASKCLTTDGLDRSVYWIFICVVCSIIGTFGAVKRSSGAIVVYVVLMLMFSSINLAHVNQMRGEMVRTCNLAQISFKNCNPTHNSQYAAILNTCINTDSCTKDQLDQTNCKAPGSKHCSDVSQTEAIFWVNAIVNFLTYAEPVWFAVLLLLRMEISGDTAPNPPQDEDERPNPGMPTVFKCQDPPEEAGAPEEASTPLLGNPSATASHTTPRDE